MALDLISWSTLIISTFVTFGLWSILTGVDNPWFAWAEHTFLGAGMGLMVVIAVDYLQVNIIPKIQQNPSENWSLIISIIIGLMMLFRLSSKTAHLARIPIAISVGTGIAISTRAIIFTGVINQVRATILPLVGSGSTFEKFTNLMIIIFVITIITFYIYTAELKGPLKISHDIGRYLLYASFGAMYAMTYQGRLGLFLGRMETMLFPMTSFYTSILIASIILVTTYILIKYYPDTLDKIVPR